MLTKEEYNARNGKVTVILSSQFARISPAAVSRIAKEVATKTSIKQSTAARDRKIASKPRGYFERKGVVKPYLMGVLNRRSYMTHSEIREALWEEGFEWGHLQVYLASALATFTKYGLLIRKGHPYHYRYKKA